MDEDETSNIHSILIEILLKLCYLDSAAAKAKKFGEGEEKGEGLKISSHHSSRLVSVSKLSKRIHKCKI